MCGSIYGCWRVRVVLGWSRYVRIVMNCGYDNEKVLGESATWIDNLNPKKVHWHPMCFYVCCCRPNDSKSRQKLPLSVPLIPNLWMVQCRLPIDDALSPRSASRSLTCRLGTILNRRFWDEGLHFFFHMNLWNIFEMTKIGRPSPGPDQDHLKGQKRAVPDRTRNRGLMIHVYIFCHFLDFLPALSSSKVWHSLKVGWEWI